mmetsp:Transcript_13498/g.15656  ORF Transcript_13498/g.15656 Transcript_13498/m.15656 type:complete len:99 (+) Transcript_13498:593-889(+)
MTTLAPQNVAFEEISFGSRDRLDSGLADSVVAKRRVRAARRFSKPIAVDEISIRGKPILAKWNNMGKFDSDMWLMYKQVMDMSVRKESNNERNDSLNE